MSELAYGRIAEEDIEELNKRYRRALRGDPVKGFTRTTTKDMAPYSILIVEALKSGDPVENLRRQYMDGVERTKMLLNRLSGRVKLYIPPGEGFEVYAWAYSDKELALFIWFPESVKMIDRRSEVEPIFIRLLDDGKIEVGSRVHYKTIMWQRVDRVDIYMSPLSHTPTLINASLATEIDPLRYAWIELNRQGGKILQPLGRIYRLEGVSLVSGDKRVDIKISPFFPKTGKKHDLPSFIREMRGLPMLKGSS
ncbi:MAG: hypothetical protein QXI22_05260 [Sulfolobales archaeon]